MGKYQVLAEAVEDAEGSFQALGYPFDPDDLAQETLRNLTMRAEPEAAELTEEEVHQFIEYSVGERERLVKEEIYAEEGPINF